MENVKLKKKLTDCIVETALLSKSSHSTWGGGFPLAVQSALLPAVLVNSNRNDGSNVNVGPCVSNEFDATYSVKIKIQT